MVSRVSLGSRSLTAAGERRESPRARPQAKPPGRDDRGGVRRDPARDRVPLRLGLSPSGEADALREQIIRALGRTPLRDLVRAVARQKHDVVALPATLIRVVDGDTILVQWEGAETLVRIRGIDAPECRDSDKSEADLDRSAMARASLWSLGEAATRWLGAHLSGRALFLHCCRPRRGPGRFSTTISTGSSPT